MTDGPLDQLEELVVSRYPKGTTDPFGREVRHLLHQMGRLNDPISEHGFVVYIPSTPSRNEPNSGWDVYITDTYAEALKARGSVEDGVIRVLEPASSSLGLGTLWAKRVKDPLNRNGEAGPH